jgi:hypothetical protein
MVGAQFFIFIFFKKEYREGIDETTSPLATRNRRENMCGVSGGLRLPRPVARRSLLRGRSLAGAGPRVSRRGVPAQAKRARVIGWGGEAGRPHGAAP